MGAYGRLSQLKPVTDRDYVHGTSQAHKIPHDGLVLCLVRIFLSELVCGYDPQGQTDGSFNPIVASYR